MSEFDPHIIMVPIDTFIEMGLAVICLKTQHEEDCPTDGVGCDLSSDLVRVVACMEQVSKDHRDLCDLYGVQIAPKPQGL